MDDRQNLNPPPVLTQILRESEALNFRMASDMLTGSLLRTLAATKPAGNFLEIGTGTGLATAWLLSGMDQESQLISIEQDASVIEVARKYLGDDRRVTFYIEDAGQWLERFSDYQFDLIFADAWPGKYSHLEKALSLLKPGGMYVIDDMLPQPSWPEGHSAKVEALIAMLEQRSDLLLTKMGWSTGIIVAVKVSL
ncbi:O-methyltransferase [Pyrinomonas methylaliphatogenes]|uniref:Predicted O-methyltransferase n=1 Tax=Pyrinomonas methylaliphatogenes TaxID=454194 RepID=A0A0B6WTP2_9BACT|nr:methyltransferase domain-containing protein [Pyrinomonas methylaliphatogenes]CDM64062.1 predicted O-methyltransferase [Pyrinomonas methylaliphatogenes]